MEKVPLLGREGGDVVLDITEIDLTERGQPHAPRERMEGQKEMSPSAAILGAVVGNKEARSYLEQKIARINTACGGIIFVGSVIVTIFEGATGALDYNGAAWAVTALTAYTSGAMTYYARKCNLLVGLSHQIDRLRGQVSRLSEEVDRLTPEVDRLSSENDRYTQLLEQHSAMQHKMQSVLESLSAKHVELAEDAVEINLAVDGLSRLRGQFDHMMPKINMLIDELKDQVNKLAGQVDKLTSQVASLEGHIKELDVQVNKLTEEINGLEKIRKGLEISVGMLSQLQGEADKQSAFNAKVNEESASLVERQEKLQTELKEIHEQAEKLHEQRKKLQLQQEDLLKEKQGLMKQLEEHAAKLNKLDKLEGLVVESAKRKLELARKLKALEAERNASKAYARKLSREKAKLEKERVAYVVDSSKEVEVQASRVVKLFHGSNEDLDDAADSVV